MILTYTVEASGIKYWLTGFGMSNVKRYGKAKLDRGFVVVEEWLDMVGRRRILGKVFNQRLAHSFGCLVYFVGTLEVTVLIKSCDDALGQSGFQVMSISPYQLAYNLTASSESGPGNEMNATLGWGKSLDKRSVEFLRAINKATPHCRVDYTREGFGHLVPPMHLAFDQRGLDLFFQQSLDGLQPVAA